MTMTSSNTMRKIADDLKKQIPSQYRFSLLIFPKSGGGSGTYLSTTDRKKTIAVLREAASKLEKNECLPIPEEN